MSRDAKLEQLRELEAEPLPEISTEETFAYLARHRRVAGNDPAHLRAAVKSDRAVADRDPSLARRSVLRQRMGLRKMLGLPPVANDETEYRRLRDPIDHRHAPIAGVQSVGEAVKHG